jgi:hypothetical protein
MWKFLILPMVVCFSLVLLSPAGAIDVNEILRNRRGVSAQKAAISRIYDKEGRCLRHARQGDTQQVYGEKNAYQGSARMPQK